VVSYKRLQRALADEAAVAAVPAAISALHTGGIRPAELQDVLPSRPGLYAIYCDEGGLDGLGMARFSGIPLYVGKAEQSLNSRDAKEHFQAGKTGWSTVRRSLAALLKEELMLTATLRNDTLPARPANYGIEGPGDARLSAWMVQRLTLSCWLNGDGLVLDHIETLVIDQWQPPLNLDKVRVPFAPLVAARERMRVAARRLVPNEVAG
jgi:hypothetical protein